MTLWETSVEIPYWWRVTTQIWVVLLIGWIEFPTRHDQSESLPRSGLWRVISMESLRSFFRRHLAGKTLVALPNVGCFLKLITTAMWRISARLNIFLYPKFSEENENEYEARMYLNLSSHETPSHLRPSEKVCLILKYHNTFCLPWITSEILGKNCFQFLLGQLKS